MPARPHLYALDGLRFFSAFAVLVFHLCFYSWATDRPGSVGEVLNHAARFDTLAPVSWFGWVGVEIFFVISGVVIANSALAASPMSFLKGRLLRLYPAVWVCATIVLIAWVGVVHKPLLEMIRPYLGSMALWIQHPWIDGVYWSLSVEIPFYALIFAILLTGGRLSLALAPWLLTALSAIYAVGVWSPTVADFIADHGALAHLWTYNEQLLLRYGAFFAVGVWLAMLGRGAMTPARYAGLAGAIGCCGAEIAFRVREMASGEVNVAMAFPLWAPLLVWAAGVAVIFVALRYPAVLHVRSPRHQAALKRLGLMTYPLFLVHQTTGAALIRVFANAGMNQWLALALAIAIVTALAFLICATLEVEIRKGLRALLERGETILARSAPRLRFLFAAHDDAAFSAPSRRRNADYVSAPR